MNIELWDKILNYDIDNPPSEYGFSIRIANENFWTKSFTELAILEYKKFMYLASVSDFMVSPSEIVDTVWHQHLIFTQSYNEFCSILGKQIQHIPSTHNKNEYLKFKQAKERTLKLYEDNFGTQPKNIWHFAGMYESLNLEKSKYKIRTIIIIGIFIIIGLASPFFYMLNPLYVKVNNPYFLIGFISMAIFTFLSLELYNETKFKKIISEFDSTSFVFKLQPLELVYANTQKISSVINAVVNELIEKDAVFVTSKNTIQLANSASTNSHEQLQITTVLYETGIQYYPDLLSVLASKPIFANTANCITSLEKYVLKSKKFSSIFYFNFIVLACLFLIFFTRIITGLVHNKHIELIVMATFVLLIFSIVYLYRLTFQFTTKAIPSFYNYKHELLQTFDTQNNWQWNYFLKGNAALAVAFTPILYFLEKYNSNNRFGNDSTGSCGSSCGSSCSSCGGCGGCGS